MSQLHIIWYGHSNIMLRESGVSVLIDPFFDGNPFAPDWREIPRPDIVAVTHDHGDHMGQAAEIVRTTGATVCCIADLVGHFREHGVPSGQIINHGMGGNIDGTLKFHGVKLTMTQAFHSAAMGSPVGYVIEMPGGFTVYHAGDTGLFGDMALIAERFAIDIAMLPVGGVFTMDGVLAAKAAAMLRVPMAMPIHYGTFPVLDQTPDLFVENLKKYAPSCRAVLMNPGEMTVLDQQD